MSMTKYEEAELSLWIVENDPNPIGYDVETSGLDWKHESPIGYVITGNKCLDIYEGYRPGTQSFYIPIRHAGGGNLADPGVPPLKAADDEPVLHWFEKRLAVAFEARTAKGYVTVGHNIQFDALFSWKMGIKLGRFMKDTQLQATMLDEHQDSFSLERTAIVFGATPKLGKPMYTRLQALFGGKNDKKQMANLWRTAGNDDMVVDYSAGDGLSTLETYWAQLPFIKEAGLETIVNIENCLIWTLVRMEHRGWRIAIERLDEVIAKTNALLEEAKAKLPHGLNVRSAAAVRAVAERAGHFDYPRTEPTERFPNGQPSFTEGYLDTFEEGKAILRVRRLEKIMSSFICPLVVRHNYKGRVHGHLNQLKADEYGTISGRLSASSPNLQQVPARDEELATLIRLLFAADPGFMLYEADYSQQEPRLWAHYSKDPCLVEGYSVAPFRDVHDTVATLVGVSRKYAKAINLGLFYLMGKTTFLKHMNKFHPGIERDETDRLHDSWYRNFTAIKAFQRKATDVFKARGWVRTILGRRARTDGSNRHYVASNRIIQGGSADITKYKLLQIDMRLEREGDRTHLLMTVHDSIIFQSPIEDKETPIWIKAMMEDLQTEPFKLSVPFVVDMTSGLDWAEVKFGKEEE